MANQVDNVVYFPENLEPNRNTWFNFYAPDMIKGLVEGLETATFKVVSIFEGNVTEVPDKLTDSIDTVVATADSVLTDLKKTMQERKTTKKLDSGNIKKQSETWKASIALPIPNNLQETLNHEWNEESGIVAHYLDKGINSLDVVSKVIQGVSTISGTRNVTTNPDYIQIYKGSKPRSIDFSWVLLPNSKKEAETLWNIIRKFKAYSSPHPSKTNAFLIAPYFCEIIFENPRMETSLRLNEMVINSISVNYSESGYMEMFYDGTPKTINLTISFVERRPKVYQDWLKEEEKSTYENKQSEQINQNEQPGTVT